MSRKGLHISRALQVIRENLGLKIGLLTGVAICLVTLLLEGIFGAVPLPLVNKLSLMQILLILGVLIALVSLLVISIATHVLVQRPLGRLMSAIHQAEAGDLKSRATVDTTDEIGQVATQFNEMLEKINGLEANRIKAEHQLTVAQEELRYKSLLEEKAAIITSTNRRLEESLKELSILYTISQCLTSSIDTDELCNKLCDVILENMELDDFAILLLNEESRQFEVKAARGFRRGDAIREVSFKVGEGVTGHAAKIREPIYIPDTNSDQEYMNYKGVQGENGSFLSVPILAKDQVLGLINFSRRDLDAFSQQEIRMLTIVAGQVAIALENARLYAKTKELSLIDELTQVYNRRHFQKILDNEIKRAERFQRPLSLIMIDVDHFKKFNDSFGHLEGDKLLVELAAIMRSNLRDIDTVARYGGEEFAIILPNTSLDDGEKVAWKLNQLAAKINTDAKKAEGSLVTISLGVSTFPTDALCEEDLVNHADVALYRAKARGRNRVVTFPDQSGRAPLRVVE